MISLLHISESRRSLHLSLVPRAHSSCYSLFRCRRCGLPFRDPQPGCVRHARAKLDHSPATASSRSFFFFHLSLLTYTASGLLWIAEVIEEHSRLAKTVGRRSIYVSWPTKRFHVPPPPPPGMGRPSFPSDPSFPHSTRPRQTLFKLALGEFSLTGVIQTSGPFQSR